MKKIILPAFTIVMMLSVICFQPATGNRKKPISPSDVDTCHYVNPKTGIRCNKLIIRGSVYCFRHRPFS